ncbi:MAG: diguanylate cyclase domain-containing protein [Hyphomonas sp.]
MIVKRVLSGMLFYHYFPGFLRSALCAALLLLALAPGAGADGAAVKRIDLASLPAEGGLRPIVDIAGPVAQDFSPEEVAAGMLEFNPATRRVPQFSGRDGDIWIRFHLVNSGADSRSAKLVLRFPYLEQVDLYERLADGSFRRSTAGAAALLTGDAVAAAYPAFHLQVPEGAEKDYFVRIRSESLVILPISLESEISFSRRVTTDALIWSLIVGAALAFAIYAASMSFTASHGVFRIYVLFALSSAAYILLTSGLLNALVGAGTSFNFTRLVFGGQAMMITFSTVFIMVFLDMQKNAPRLNRVFLGVALVGAATGVSYLMPAWLGRLAYFTATGGGPVVIAAGLAWMAARGVPRARSVLIAWLPCLAATVCIYLRVLGLTPYMPINHFLVPLTFAFTLAYLSAMLGGQARMKDLWAHSDTMTGLSNRRHLANLAELESRQSGERYGAAVAIDLDRLKPVNQTHGPAAGDAVITAMAERLRAQFAGKGDVFRLGGDEFLVLGYHWVERMEIISRANAFLQSAVQPVCHEDHYISVGVSVGISFYDPRTGFSGLLKQADAELYLMKTSGGGGIRIADQRQRDRRRTESVLFADYSQEDDAIARMFANG